MSRTNKLVVVVDDDPLVLEATGGLLRSWGCRVVVAESCAAALAKLFAIGQRPDLIVCDHCLPQGRTGVDAIELLRRSFEIPALLISGDAAAPQSEGGAGGYRLLYKPVNAEDVPSVSGRRVGVARLGMKSSKRLTISAKQYAV